jgi:hypothetical protein
VIFDVRSYDVLVHHQHTRNNESGRIQPIYSRTELYAGDRYIITACTLLYNIIIIHILFQEHTRLSQPKYIMHLDHKLPQII